MNIFFKKVVCAHVVSTLSEFLKRNYGGLGTPTWKVRYLVSVVSVRILPSPSGACAAMLSRVSSPEENPLTEVNCS